MNTSARRPAELIAVLKADFVTRREGFVVIAAAAPAEVWPGMLWYDTVAGKLKVRDAANAAWYTI